MAAGRRWVEGDFVLASTGGTPLYSGNVTKALQRPLVRAGLPRQRFHDLRRACETLGIEEDVEELGCRVSVLGHPQVATTADLYAHLTQRCHRGSPTA